MSNKIYYYNYYERDLMQYPVVQLFNGENHIPSFSPYDISVLNLKIPEVSWFEVLGMLWVRIIENERLKIDDPVSSIGEEQMKCEIPCILCSLDANSVSFHDKLILIFSANRHSKCMIYCQIQQLHYAYCTFSAMLESNIWGL